MEIVKASEELLVVFPSFVDRARSLGVVVEDNSAEWMDEMSMLLANCFEHEGQVTGSLSACVEQWQSIIGPYIEGARTRTKAVADALQTKLDAAVEALRVLKAKARRAAIKNRDAAQRAAEADDLEAEVGHLKQIMSTMVPKS